MLATIVTYEVVLMDYSNPGEQFDPNLDTNDCDFIHRLS